MLTAGKVGGVRVGGGRAASGGQEPPNWPLLESQLTNHVVGGAALHHLGGAAAASSSGTWPGSSIAGPPTSEDARRVARGKRLHSAVEQPDSDTDPDDGASPAGTGVLGCGPPLRAGLGPHSREIHDGAGLCSPGRWPPERRSPPTAWTIKAFGAALRREVVALTSSAGLGAEAVFDKLATGGFQDSPFPPARTQALRAYARELLAGDGLAALAEPRVGDRPRPVNVRLLQALLTAAGDPDRGVWDTFAKGVPTGVSDRLPRTPAVYGRKRRWRLPEQHNPDGWLTPLEAHPWRENYSSVKGHEAEMRRQLDELVNMGLMLKMTPAAYHARWPSCTVASLGAATKEKDAGVVSVRLVFDGTHGTDLNKRIRVRDQERPPSALDAKALLRAQSKRRRPTLGLAADARNAHRTIMIAEADWGHQACRAEGDPHVFVSTCGTFGVSSISYWWNRLASALVRLGHYLALPEDELWILLLADDFKVESSSPRPKLPVLMFLWSLEVLGVALQWRKVQGGSTIAWVGYEFLLSEHALGISEHRAQWAIRWCHRVVRDGAIRVGELREGLGRLGYIAAALDYDRPFLAPIYTFVALHPSPAVRQLPLFVLTCLSYFAHRLAHRRHYSMAISPTLVKDGPRVDAYAEGKLVGIGGWLPARSPSGQLLKGASQWFSIELNERNAAWAFARNGEPYRNIAALEAYGVLLSIIAFAPSLPADAKTKVRLQGLTDNLANSFSITRLMTTKYPLLAIIMEIAAQCEARNLVADLEWVPRELNDEADALSRGIFDGFDPRLRVPVDLDLVPWRVLPLMLEQGQQLQALKKELRANAKPTHAAPAARRGRRVTLKDKDPW